MHRPVSLCFPLCHQCCLPLPRHSLPGHSLISRFLSHSTSRVSELCLLLSAVLMTQYCAHRCGGGQGEEGGGDWGSEPDVDNFSHQAAPSSFQHRLFFPSHGHQCGNVLQFVKPKLIIFFSFIYNCSCPYTLPHCLFLFLSALVSISGTATLSVPRFNVSVLSSGWGGRH